MTDSKPAVDLMAALKQSVIDARQRRTEPIYNTSHWPDFVPGVRVSRCGQGSSHGPHHENVGPDQPRNCPGTGKWATCPNCTQLVQFVDGFGPFRHQVDGDRCEPAEVA